MISTGGSRCVDGADGCFQVEAGSSIGLDRSRDRTTRAMHAGKTQKVYNMTKLTSRHFIPDGSEVWAGCLDD